MTPRQLTVARAIQDYCDEHGCSPTYQELGDTLGICKVTVHEHVETLVKLGVLAREYRATRSLRVLVRLEDSLRERVIRDIEKAITMATNRESLADVTAHLRRVLEDL